MNNYEYNPTKLNKRDLESYEQMSAVELQMLSDDVVEDFFTTNRELDNQANRDFIDKFLKHQFQAGEHKICDFLIDTINSYQSKV